MRIRSARWKAQPVGGLETKPSEIFYGAFNCPAGPVETKANWEGTRIYQAGLEAQPVGRLETGTCASFTADIMA